MNGAAPRRVTCPCCKAPALFAAANRWRPFCVERCASIDLGAWASESYRMEAATPVDPGTLEPPSDSRH